MTFLEKVLALTPQTPEASTVPEPIGRPDGPGLWRHKHLQLPPYIQHVAHALMAHGHGESDAIHMAVGIVKHWAEGHDGHGHKTHPDVRAAAAANVAKWEEARASAHAETAARHAKGHGSKGDRELAASYQVISQCLLELTQAGAVGLAFPDQPGPPQSSFLKNGTAPGARPLSGRLFHVPSQTVQGAPPLPPGVTLPTPAELHSFAAELQSVLPGSDLVRGAAAHARAAATKMQANQPADALHMLRSCQAGIVSAHREFNASQVPVANVFVASLDPAEQSSAQASMYEGLGTREKFRKLTSQCAVLRDRIRRHYFHGMYNHAAEARFTAADNQVSSDQGMIYLDIPANLLPAGYPPAGLPHLTVIYLGHITPQQFEAACERARSAARSLPVLHGSMGGLGFFDPSVSSEGRRVAYAPVHVDGVWQLRSMLGDLAAPESHPFSPHVTLALLGPDDVPPPPVTAARLCFRQLLVRRGDQVRAFAFTGHHGGHGHGRQTEQLPPGIVPLTGLRTARR